MAREIKRLQKRMDKAVDRAQAEADKLLASVTVLKARIAAKLRDKAHLG